MAIISAREGTIDGASAAVDADTFRMVLGHFPTGVALVSGVDSSGSPVGMVVGSFTSVSLDPPLVAFLPDKKSSTFSRLREASRFVVNILSAEQESTCRTFASKSIVDKWAGIEWRSSANGTPMLDGAVGWIECEYNDVIDAGDHFIVLGRVIGLEVGIGGEPLVFHRGGYGKFASLSLVAPADADLMKHLRAADAARDEMERLVNVTGLSCSLLVMAGDELVVVAGAGRRSVRGPRGLIGARMPVVPPQGAGFYAWAPEERVEEWLAKAPVPLSEARREEVHDLLAHFRTEGWVVDAPSREWVAVLDELVARGEASDVVAKWTRVVAESERSWLTNVEAGKEYHVRFAAAAVVLADRTVAQNIILDLPGRMSGKDLLFALAEVKKSAKAVARKLDALNVSRTPTATS